MTENNLHPLDLPAVKRKMLTAHFAGMSISSDGLQMLLREAERQPGMAETLVGCMRDRRDPAQAIRTLPTMLSFHMLAGACG